MGTRIGRPGRSWALAAVVAAVVVSGCGGGGESGGAASPEAAVTAFLEPLARFEPSSGRDAEADHERALALWRTMCDRVDPAIRDGLIAEAADGDPVSDRSLARAACGSLVVTAAMYAGDSGELGQPQTLSGTPRSAITHGTTSVVTVDVHYTARADLSSYTKPPPAHATIKVLTVEHGGRWWVATPQAFDPRRAADGGRTEAELRRDHAELLAAAR